MAGWQPVPGGKHGGMRRKVGGKWQYKYPSQMDARNAMRHHRSHANKHLNVPGHDSGSGHDVKHSDPDKAYEATREAYRHHKDAMEGAAAFAESGRPSSSETRRKQRHRAAWGKAEPDSLDLVRGSPLGTSIAEFGETVGEIQYTEPAPLAPGYQGGLYKADGGSHKYRSRKRKMVGGKLRWEYEYDEPKKQQSAQPDQKSIADMADAEVEAAIKKEVGSVDWSWGGPGRPVTATAHKFSDAQFTAKGKDRAEAGRKLLAMERAYRAGTFDPTSGSKPYMSDPGPSR